MQPLTATKMSETGHAICPACGSENTGHTAGDFSGCNKCSALFQVPAHQGNGDGYCALDCPGLVGKHDRPLPTKEEQARALRTKAIDASHALCEVMDAMERLGFNGNDVRLWLTWSILPGNLMEAARESQWSRADSSRKIEEAVCPWMVA